MRILVTGAGGFLAQHLIPALLKEGHEVSPIDNLEEFDEKSKKGIEYGDIREPFTFARFKDCEAVIHLAAIAAPDLARRNKAEAFNINVRGTFNILEFARKSGMKKVVFMSSAHVYGISPHYVPTPETHSLTFHDTYTATKVIGEHLCQQFYDSYGLPYTILRLFNGYGPGQSFDYFVPSMVAKASATRKIVLRGADTTKDFVFVEDVMEAMVRALKTDYVGEINIGSGKQTKLEEVAQYIASKFDAKYERDANQPPETHMEAGTTRAEKVLGWKATTPLEEGLDRTMEALMG